MQLKYSYHLYLVLDQIHYPCLHQVHKGQDGKYYVLLDVSKGPARLKQELETLRKLHPEKHYTVIHHYCNVIAEYIPMGASIPDAAASNAAPTGDAT